MKNKENIFLEKMLDLVFPFSIYCITCGSIIDESRSYGLCDSCIEKFNWFAGISCNKCGKILDDLYKGELCYDCLGKELNFDRGFTCCQYGLYARKIIMDYKYGDKSYLGKIIGNILYDRVKLEGIKPDLILPVPIHTKRLKQRGYNQVEISSKVLSKKTGIHLDNNILKRSKDTIPMKGLDINERRENVKSAFSLVSENKHKIQSKETLLVDDIYTTGMTVDSCAKILKQEGKAAKVYVLTFAAGGNRPPEESL